MSKTGGYQRVKIIENVQIYENVYKMVVSCNIPCKPGQFCMLRNWNLDPILSRPISICDADENSMTFLYLVVGKGTKLLSMLKAKDEIQILGPLGNGFTIGNYKKVALISGGIGIAPLLLLAKKLHEFGIKADLYSGFKDLNYATESFEPHVSKIYLASESGAIGTKGNVLHIFEDQEYDMIYACGPNRMLEALKQFVTSNMSCDLQLSLESHMACGIGACLGCTVKTTEKMSRVCMEGPVFNAKEVVFDA